MIYDRGYVKALIAKAARRGLTAAEAAEYHAAQKIYTDEEFDEMVAETLLEMGDEIPGDGLEGWRPDFEAIYAKEKPVKKHWWPWRITAVALLMLVGAGVLFYWFRSPQEAQIFVSGPCAGLTVEKEVPVDEYAVALRWGETEVVQVGKKQHGELLREGSIRVFKTEEGVFRFARQPSGSKNTAEAESVTLTTGLRQQALVELADGTRIRLNAQSGIRYAPTAPPEEALKIIGEAYVQRPTGSAEPLLIRTENARIRCAKGEFVLLSVKQGTRVAALQGRIGLQLIGNEKQLLLEEGTRGSVSRYTSSATGQITDSIKHEGPADRTALLVWTKAVRRYKDMPLREFVAQMSRWYGFEVQDYRCLPAEQRVTTTVCYRRDKEAAYAAIREAGVRFYESKGMISFCPDDAKVSEDNKVALALWKR